MGWWIAGTALVVATGAALVTLFGAKKDADKNFSTNDVGSVIEGCPAESGPKLVSDGAAAIIKSNHYKDCPEKVKLDITSKEFTSTEKKGIQEVLDRYKSLTKCENSPVKKIGRTNKGITKDKNGCVAETSTMGEWFDDSGTLVLTDAASKPIDFSDKEIQFKGTTAHELAHGLLNKFDPRDCKAYDSAHDNPLMKEFRKAAGWDSTGTVLTQTGTDQAPTDYAKTNSQEDLSESMMLYLYDSDKLKNASPARYQFCKKLLGEK